MKQEANRLAASKKQKQEEKIDEKNQVPREKIVHEMKESIH